MNILWKCDNNDDDGDSDGHTHDSHMPHALFVYFYYFFFIFAIRFILFRFFRDAFSTPFLGPAKNTPKSESESMWNFLHSKCLIYKYICGILTSVSFNRVEFIIVPQGLWMMAKRTKWKSESSLSCFNRLFCHHFCHHFCRSYTETIRSVLTSCQHVFVFARQQRRLPFGVLRT